jgi:hypothetical protein
VPLYSIDIKVAATAYIKADSKKAALKKAKWLRLLALELKPDDNQEVPICGLKFDDHDLPEVSLSPAMTLHGPFRGSTIELVED